MERTVMLEEYGTDFMVTPSDPGGTISAPALVFVGYGYDPGKGWDDFRNRDVKGRLFFGLPDFHPHWNRAASNTRATGFPAIRTGWPSPGAAIIEVDPSGRDEFSWYEKKGFHEHVPLRNRQAMGWKILCQVHISVRKEYSSQAPESMFPLKGCQ
ncbi:MAG: hypothetical protein R2744_08250 [Bacteroidales bacterium]